MTGRPTHFEIPVDDPDRAEKFYSSVFGWTFERYPGAPQYYGLATTGKDSEQGINGGFFQRAEGSGISITMDVDSIEDSLTKIEAEGGQMLQGRTPIPGIGWFATCRDTEGNAFGIYKDDPSAK